MLKAICCAAALSGSANAELCSRRTKEGGGGEATEENHYHTVLSVDNVSPVSQRLTAARPQRAGGLCSCCIAANLTASLFVFVQLH